MHLCLSVRTSYSQTIAIDLICFHNKCYTRGSVLLLIKMIGIWSLEFIYEFFTLARYDNVCHQTTPRRQMCAMMKTCVMTSSHVRHSERGSDCLVLIKRARV